MNPDDAEEYTQALGQVVSGSWRQIALAKRLGVPEALGLSTQEWVDNRLGGYVRLSIADRREAAKELTEEGMSQREVADVLGVDAATVNRSLRPPVANATPGHEDDQATGVSSVANATPEPDALSDDELDDLAPENVSATPTPTPAERERIRDERERREAIARQVNRLRNLIDGWETVTHLRNNPLRDDVLDAIGEFDRNLIIKIEEAIS
jgi:transcriptional regulator with XRE-family HTH domain